MKKLIIYSVLALFISLTLSYGYSKIVDQSNTIQRLSTNIDRLLNDNAGLALETSLYKTKDSLNAAKIKSLELTISEYKKYREKDLAIIASLNIRMKDIETVISARLETVDTVKLILHDTLYTPKAFNYSDRWTAVSGYIDDDTLRLSVHNTEELKIVERVNRKRVLGFLWYHKKFESRSVDIVSLNPNTEIKNVDYVRLQ